MKVFFLGPPGTYSEQAALELFDGTHIEPLDSISDLFKRLALEPNSAILVPYENSTFGPVRETARNLLLHPHVTLLNSATVQVRHALLCHSQGVGQVRRILSHPQALGQCASSIARVYPQAELVATSSTAEAAEMVASSAEEGMAAIASPSVAQSGRLQVLHESFQDEDNNQTRFLVLQRSQPGAEPFAHSYQFKDMRSVET